MLLVNCDPFRSFSFSFICSPELCENTCNGVLLKKAEAANIQERISSKFLSCKICEIFQNSFLLEQLSMNVSVSGVGPAQPYQSNKYLIWITKGTNTLTSNQSNFVK